MAAIRVGMAGWTYPPWRGNFYPDGLTQKLELQYASRRFNALEVNGTFYSLQKPASFQSWYDATPSDFVFTLKGGKYLTHDRKLRDAKQPLANFLASGLLCLREKLGAILWQLPPSFRFDAEVFKAFFDLLPHDTDQMSRLAKQHDDFVKGRAFVEADANRPVRHAVEFRNQTFLTDDFIDLARQHNIAVVIADAASEFPSTEDATADWLYIRLHGMRPGHDSGYRDTELQAWAEKIRTWHKGGEPKDARLVGGPAKPAKSGRDVFVLFDNTEIKERSPVNARQIAELLGVAPPETPDQLVSVLMAQPAKAKPSRATPKQASSSEPKKEPKPRSPANTKPKRTKKSDPR